MEERLKQRLVGAVVIASLAVIIVPVLLDVPREGLDGAPSPPVRGIPERPADRFESSATVTLDEPETPRLDAEAQRERGASDPDRVERRLVPETYTTLSIELPDASGESPAPPVRVEPSGEGSSPAAGTREPREAPGAPSGESGSATTGAPPDASGESSAPTDRTQASGEGSPPPAGTSEPRESSGARSGESGSATATGGATGTDRWTVQLGSFRESGNAVALRDRLLAEGYAAFVDVAPSAQGEVSRVFVGPMDDREQARVAAAKLLRELQIEGFVTPHPDG